MNQSARKVLLTLWILTIYISSIAQNENQIEPKYLSALLYLRTNTEINEKIKETFYKNPNKAPDYINFNLSNRITFLKIDLVEYDDERYNPKTFKESYFFEPYLSKELRGLVESDESDFFLTFSKPVDNILMSELTTFNPEVLSIKMGLAMPILFIFDEYNKVEMVITNVITYN